MSVLSNPLESKRGAELIAAPTRFLRWGIFLSILIHAAVLAWQRQASEPPRPQVSELEIVMLNASTESTPVQPRALAQVSADGAGQATQGIASNTLPYVGDVPEAVVLERLTKQRLQLEAEQQQLLTQLKSSLTAAEGRPAEQFLKNPQQPGQHEKDQAQVLLNNKITALSEQVQHYNQRPRKYFDAPSAQQALYVEYIDQWRQRIETLGAQHYPSGLEGKAYGSVQASLTIRADGVMTDISIERPSDKALLNQAVRRIAQLASPFAPFSTEMAKQVDLIVLTRTWHFVDGKLQTSSP